MLTVADCKIFIAYFSASIDIKVAAVTAKPGSETMPATT